MNNINKIKWILRIGVAGEFVGHGLLAMNGKQDWIRWITQVLYTSPVVSEKILLFIGMFDLIVGLIILIRPIRPIILWAVFWGFWTALLRPLVGLSWLEFIERFANWSAPLALYYLHIFKRKNTE